MGDCWEFRQAIRDKPLEYEIRERVGTHKEEGDENIAHH